MCGIAGVWNPEGDLRVAVERMTIALKHRGPDESGYFLDEPRRLALGHRRLSIVDLSPTGAQPMSSICGRYVISFNGEVYNFRQLRQQLIHQGVVFRGTSDTEVMLECIRRYGVQAAVEMFAGMFAFAVYDRKDSVLWLVRDRMGEKPLYYGTLGNTFAWASEIKSFRTLNNRPTRIDPAAVADVLARGYVRGTRSIYHDVRRLLPGSLMKVAWDGERFHAETEKYWSVSQHIRQADHDETAGLSVSEAATCLAATLREVISEEMVADVPLGAFLSGGVDSSLVVALMQEVGSRPVRTFTIALDDPRYDESIHAKTMALRLGTEHTEIGFTSRDLLGLFSMLPDVYDEPFGDSSALPTMLVSRATRDYVTVALSGDGGDELFGGYSQYLNRDSIGRLVSRVPGIARPAVAALAGAIPGSFYAGVSSDSLPSNTKARLSKSLRARTPRESHEALLSTWVNPADIMAEPLRTRLPGSLLEESWPHAPSYQESQMAYDMVTYLPDDIMVKVDRAAMAVSLETRAPLLDHRVVELALGLPESVKIARNTGKLVLKELLGRYVPRSEWDRPKQGFAIPVSDWLRRDLRSQVTALIDDVGLVREWFDAGVIRSVWNRHLNGADHGAQLWRAIVILQWARAKS